MQMIIFVILLAVTIGAIAMRIFDIIVATSKSLTFVGLHGDPRHTELGFNMTLQSECGREYITHFSEVEARHLALEIMYCLGEYPPDDSHDTSINENI